MKKILIFFIIFNFLISQFDFVYASEILSYLCEIGLRFYQQGRYDEALEEFKKALLVNPNYGPALKYIQMIEKMKEKEASVFLPQAPSPTRKEAIQELLDYFEKEKIKEELPKEIPLKPEVKEIPLKPEVKIEKIPPSLVIKLDESLNTIMQPIEIEQGKSVIILGKNIQRFLATSLDILIIEKKSNDELLVTAKELGYTYLHIWDENGRWTTEWLGVPPKPEGPTYEELMLKEEERARNFKLRYSMDWYSYETGRRIDELERNSYGWSYGLSIDGPTPYGKLDSSASIRRLKTSTDLTYFTLGLTDGNLGKFKGFSLRGFDFYPNFSNLSFSGATLRGVMLSSAAFNNKLSYTAFWGREGAGRYGNLSPGLSKIRHSFLEGFNLNYSLTKTNSYRFSLVHGHGRDRAIDLNRYGYDLISSWNFDKWGINYEVAQDSENFAHLLNAHFSIPKLNFNTELREISKKFLSITGSGWRQGERGGIFNLNYTPFDKLSISSSLNLYQDRLSPAEDNDQRLNEDFDLSLNYQIDPLTSLGLSYSLQNELGRIYQYRYQNVGTNLYHTFKFIRDIYTYINYYHQESKNFSSPLSDYINDRIYAGIRFNLIGQLYYYLNKEINFVEARGYGDTSHPHALETGLDYSAQLGKTPLYSNLRFSFRDEEETVAPLSFLSGEDYIEGYLELAYRPNPDMEVYGSGRFRNIWQDNPNVTKRMELDFNAGMRYLWDTGLRWEAVGDVEGYVFKDLNSDGLRQKDEPPVEGIKIWLGKNKSCITDLFGYYNFKKIKAQKVYITLDTSTLPSGYVLTVPVTQEAVISHLGKSRVDFGIICRSEISGFVFEDVDGDGQYSRKDKAVSGVEIILEDGSKAITDATGRYVFSRASVGEHTLTLNLNSLPLYYLPQVPIKTEIFLSEGMTYTYNIPLKRTKE